jgi:2-oxoglutarate ferredoxin oxidoreductase subunit gamma
VLCMRNTNNNVYEEILIAGFGGQGILLAGKLLAQAAMKTGHEVTCMPSYGAEVRGGTANCMVVISNQPIASPLVGSCNSLIAMNKASLDKFAPCIKPAGLLIMNSSLIDEMPKLDKSIEILAVPADEIAVELGNQKVANMVVLGAYLQRRGIISPDAAAACLEDVIAEHHHRTVPINTQAIHRGAEFART